MVLTQTCDLVRRVGSAGNPTCKARYISIAAVRPISLVFQREIQKFQYTPIEAKYQLCNENYRGRIKDFIARVLNNNEPEFFYLREEPSCGLTQPHCAFLALSIPVKSELHYDKILAAKILQLEDGFQHKLGWLTGNLYSRVGTPDWVPDVCTKEDFDNTINELLDRYCLWVEASLKKPFDRLLKSLPEAELTSERVIQEYGKIKSTTPKKKDLLVNRIIEIMTEEGIELPVTSKIKRLIMSDQDVAGFLKK